MNDRLLIESTPYQFCKDSQIAQPTTAFEATDRDGYVSSLALSGAFNAKTATEEVAVF